MKMMLAEGDWADMSSHVGRMRRTWYGAWFGLPPADLPLRWNNRRTMAVWVCAVKAMQCCGSDNSAQNTLVRLVFFSQINILISHNRHKKIQQILWLARRNSSLKQLRRLGGSGCTNKPCALNKGESMRVVKAKGTRVDRGAARGESTHKNEHEM